MLKMPVDPLTSFRNAAVEDPQWTLAETVLMDPQNITVIDNIYGNLNLASVIALSRTSFKGRVSWLTYKERIFNIIKLLSNYFAHPSSFREMQRQTGAVIIGEVPLLYFNRCSTVSRIVDIAVNTDRISNIVHHFLNIEGFKIWDGTKWVGELDWIDKEIRCIRCHESSMHTPRLGHINHDADSSMPIDRFSMPQTICGRLVLFEKTSPSGSIQVIRAWMTNAGTSKLVLQSKNSQ